ncbi:MAG: VOC family protein [Chloroflexota bacterium]|nr:VOC family protein [Chloroflexota bacterium]
MSEFWAQVLGYVIEDEKGDWVLMRPSEGLGPRLAFAPVPEPKTVKNRVHLDIQPSGTTLESEVERLGALGATRVRLARNAPDEIHTVM